MRNVVVLVLFAASLAQAGYRNYEEVRELELSTQGIDSLSIDAGAGSMDVNGVANSDFIQVIARVGVSNANAEKANKIIDERMQLALTKSGDVAELTALFEDGFMGSSSDAYIALEVNVPKGLNIRIDDGAGSIDIVGVDSDVSIDDGSGSIDIVGAANVTVDDGSGSIEVDGAAGNVSIVDGSGSISVRDVDGSVTIDDGSGGIKVRDIENDLIIVNDGSGGLSFHDVRGTVDAET